MPPPVIHTPLLGDLGFQVLQLAPLVIGHRHDRLPDAARIQPLAATRSQAPKPGSGRMTGGEDVALDAAKWNYTCAPRPRRLADLASWADSSKAESRVTYGILVVLARMRITLAR